MWLAGLNSSISNPRSFQFIHALKLILLTYAAQFVQVNPALIGLLSAFSDLQ
jgi:hypothetical protein